MLAAGSHFRRGLKGEETMIKTNDFHHELWLIYTQLRDAESDATQRLELLEYAREGLGKLINKMCSRRKQIAVRRK